jgi:hypothetical protein
MDGRQLMKPVSGFKTPPAEGRAETQYTEHFILFSSHLHRQ